MTVRNLIRLSVGLLAIVTSGVAAPPEPFGPGRRVLLHAHNAYPYEGRWRDRLERALSTAMPLAIEQDLVWDHDPRTGRPRSIVSHGEPFTGDEPTIEAYFFERIRPLVEQALHENRPETWPLIVLHLDFKTNEPEHHRAVWDLLGRYESWLTTAPRTSSVSEIADLRVGPVLVLTEDADEQERSFHDRVPVGATLRLFGAVHSRLAQAGTPAEARVKAGEELPDVSPAAKTNYRRWWNLPWSVVELGGQAQAGEWTRNDEHRLERLVDAAHRAALWIRFYTLNGHDPADQSGGWSAGYNFGSRAAVEHRWVAAIRAGVDFVAVDQYEEFAAVARTLGATAISRVDGVVLDGVVTRADYERLFEREFDVPSGAERIDIELTYDAANRTVLDLGLRGPAGFRGWSGGGAQRIFVASHSASYGYTPGPIEPGRWAAILGVANIREGTTAPYEVAVRFSSAAGDWPTLRPEAGWYAGDLHVHSGHSDGRTAGPSGERLRVPPQHVFNAARGAGLDFVALTDHNTASHWADVDRLQPLYPTMLLLHAREVTTYRGHLNAFGERRFVDFRLRDGRPMRALAADLADAGAVLSINHPRRPDDETCMGCGWNDRDDATIREVHAVEIVNGSSETAAIAGWPFWADMLNRGHRLTAIGGSDEHTPDESHDQRLGSPTTVIYARDLSEAALLDGLRAGRAYVRTRGPNGPAVEFSADAAGRTYMMGDIVPPGALTLHVTITGATGQRLEWIHNGKIIAAVAVPADGRLRQVVQAELGDWFSIVLRDRHGPTLFSNALYVRTLERAAQ